MPGRPARMIRSEWCRPPVLALIVSSPVVMPERPPPELSAFSAICTAHARRLGEALDRCPRRRLPRRPGRAPPRPPRSAPWDRPLRDVSSACSTISRPTPTSARSKRQIVDLLGEVAGADDRRARAGQLGEIGGAAQLLHLLVRLEQRPERDRRGDHVAVEQPQDLLVDAPVQRLEEMLGAQLELDVLGQPVVDHQRAEQGRLGLDIVRAGPGLGGRGVDRRRCGWAMVCDPLNPSAAAAQASDPVELVWIAKR